MTKMTRNIENAGTIAKKYAKKLITDTVNYIIMVKKTTLEISKSQTPPCANVQAGNVIVHPCQTAASVQSCNFSAPVLQCTPVSGWRLRKRSSVLLCRPYGSGTTSYIHFAFYKLE